MLENYELPSNLELVDKVEVLASSFKGYIIVSSYKFHKSRTKPKFDHL